jgi:2-polyprenyl-3-methyl-5-hydroxy-6-metoxy-1,4-benzoquinol methylase
MTTFGHLLEAAFPCSKSPMISAVSSSGSDYFDEAEFAQREQLEDHHYWHLHRRQLLLNELAAFRSAPACGALLEIGCGIGTVATFLNENGYRVDYADYFENALSIAKRRAQVRLGAEASARSFLRVDATVPLELERRYDGVLMLDVIEHLPDDRLVLRHVHAALDSGAFVMVTVPAFQALWSPWDDMEKHKRRYTRASLERVLADAGFELRRSTYFFMPLFFAALGMKLVRTARQKTLGAARATDITQLAEAKNVEALNRLMLAVLSPERRWMPGHSLPLGTSVLAIASKR